MAPPEPVVAPSPLVPAAPPPAPAVARLPMALKVLWTIWVAAVSVNLTVWVLVSFSHGDPDYFWPMWLVVPGAALFGVSAAVLATRRGGPHPPSDGAA